MSLIAITLLEGTGDTEDDIIKEIPLDYDSRKYVHVKMNNIIKKFDSAGVMTKYEYKYPME